jgi:hypothetical protein
MTDEQQGGFSQAWWARLRNSASTIGEFKQLLSLATGCRVDNLRVFVTRGGYSFTLPDDAPVPADLYICIQPE